MNVLPVQMTRPVSEPDVENALIELLESRSMTPGRVPTSVLASWQRAIHRGLQPNSTAIDTAPPSRDEVGRLLRASEDLIEAAKDCMEALCNSLPGANHWVALCVSSEGRIVHGVGNRNAVPRLLQLALQVGRSVREAELGTTAVGCALMETMTRVHIVKHNEHFLRELSPLVCAAVPIHGPQGDLTGVINLTGAGVSMDPSALHRLCLVTAQVENNLLLQLPDRIAVHLNDDPRLVGTPYEGLISIDETRNTCLLNAAARRLLGIDGEPKGAIDADQLFDRTQWQQMMFDTKSRAPMRSVRDHRGYLLHAGRFENRITRLAPCKNNGTGVQARGVPDADTSIPVNKDPRIASILCTGVKALDRNVPLILEGESGTGKELMAQAIHQHSNRAHKPLVAINCAAIPEGLIEAELFGYVDGAFTGGRRGGSPGKISQAQGGTLFLDEIGDMPLSLQTRLLRVLQERQFTPVGGLHPVSVEFALICATHRNLAQAVENGAFRGDLFYRIDGLLLQLPALRDREDLMELVQHFLLECGDGSNIATLDDEVCAFFATYSWPGNIRQLRNVIRASNVLAGEKTRIGLNDLPDAMRREFGLNGVPIKPASETALTLAKLETIRRILASVDGNVTRAAKILGLSRSTLHKQLRHFGLR